MIVDWTFLEIYFNNLTCLKTWKQCCGAEIIYFRLWPDFLPFKWVDSCIPVVFSLTLNWLECDNLGSSGSAALPIRLLSYVLWKPGAARGGEAAAQKWKQMVVFKLIYGLFVILGRCLVHPGDRWSAPPAASSLPRGLQVQGTWQRHNTWIRIKTFVPIWIRIQAVSHCYIISFDKSF